MFSEIYNAVRSKEVRIFSDEDVKRLPVVDESHPHAREWKIRAGSAKWLKKELERSFTSPKILEVGCGNGWLSAFLSENKSWQVTGIDINTYELEQAQRSFRNKKNLRFENADIMSGNITKKFDVILFAASIQYFSSLPDILHAALGLLNGDGKIYILDSIFYKKHETESAKKRTDQYYTKLGIPEMTDHYFHHSIESLKDFNYKILGRPDNFFIRNLRKNPFYRICILAEPR
jgi:SAM-dependent methyltransferase